MKTLQKIGVLWGEKGLVGADCDANIGNTKRLVERGSKTPILRENLNEIEKNELARAKIIRVRARGAKIRVRSNILNTCTCITY